MRRLLLLALLVPLAAACGGHKESSPAGDTVARWVALERLPPQAVPGARLFDSEGCTACHVYAGSGRSTLGGPDLTAIGRRELGIRFQIDHLKCPSCVNPGSPMPPSRHLTAKELRRLAIFLEASKGTH
jgi:mono/diheme cytochrome c family protein